MTEPYQDVGDWRRWEDIWRGARATGEGAVLYTPGTPRTILELWQRAYFEDLWELMKDTAASARFLELGSGRGTTSMYLASRECDVTLVDLAPAALDLAVRNFRLHGLREPQTHSADARNTGLPSSAYDCVYNIGLLEHFHDPVPVLKESLRLLKPGGLIFMVIVPEAPPRRLPPVRLALNPVGSANRILRAVGRRLGNRPASARGSPAGATMVRTNHPREQYVRWMQQLGQHDVQCVPYNPYFSVYESPALNRLVAVPIYRWHLRIKRLRAEYPLLQTRSVASCDLLVCRKN